jgi:hypothetical protein
MQTHEHLLWVLALMLLANQPFSPVLFFLWDLYSLDAMTMRAIAFS